MNSMSHDPEAGGSSTASGSPTTGDPRTANRMKDIPFSSIRSMFERVDEMKARGLAPIPFYIGQPDFDTPEHIRQAAKDALDHGLTAYTSNYGLPALRQAIARKLQVDNDIRVDPDRQVIVTVGSNEAVLLAMLASLNPGDEVLIPDPSWLHYFYCARLAGARPVSVPLREENKFQLDPDDLERAASPRTRMLVLNSPHNPTGALFSRETVQAVARFVERRGLLLISDEIYEKLIYSDWPTGANPPAADLQPYTSPGAIPAIAGQTITVNGFSKAYAMTGWRVGYAAASPPLIDAMIRVHQYTTICATSFAQAGAAAALNGPQDCVQSMLAEFSQRRAAVIEGIQCIPELKLVPPQGAFYAFVNVKALGTSSEAVARDLLEKAGVAVVPGNAFGEYGEGYIRISFACTLAQVQQGMRAIQRYCQQGLPESKGFENP
jgi:aminotransferase